MYRQNSPVSSKYSLPESIIKDISHKNNYDTPHISKNTPYGIVLCSTDNRTLNELIPETVEDYKTDFPSCFVTLRKVDSSFKPIGQRFLINHFDRSMIDLMGGEKIGPYGGPCWIAQLDSGSALEFRKLTGTSSSLFLVETGEPFYDHTTKYALVKCHDLESNMGFNRISIFLIGDSLQFIRAIKNPDETYEIKSMY